MHFFHHIKSNKVNSSFCIYKDKILLGAVLFLEGCRYVAENIILSNALERRIILASASGLYTQLGVLFAPCSGLDLVVNVEEVKPILHKPGTFHPNPSIMSTSAASAV